MTTITGLFFTATLHLLRWKIWSG